MKDLRELKAWLEERGEVAHVTREVDPEYELVAVAKKINEKYGKAVYFENVKGSKYPVFTYALANRDGIAAALNMEPTQMTHQWSRREEQQLPYKIVESGPDRYRGRYRVPPRGCAGSRVRAERLSAQSQGDGRYHHQRRGCRY